LLAPVVLQKEDAKPTAVFATPVVLYANALLPKAAFALPDVLLLNAQKPTAVLLSAIFEFNAKNPKDTLLLPDTFAQSAA